MPSALVTGCAGFIGSHLVEELIQRNWHVTGIDNFHPYYPKFLKEANIRKARENKKFHFIEGSILSTDDLKLLPSNVDYVFHFAAIAGVRNSIEHPQEYFEINVNGTLNLLNHYRNVSKFIFASSSSVYGNLKEEEFPVRESHELDPISPYGESKKQAEKLCMNFSKEHGLKTTMLRFYTVYGPRQRPDEAITKFIRLAQSNKEIEIYGDGKKERDFTFVSDIVNGAILAAEKGNGIYNLGTGNPITVNHMIETIEKTMKKKIAKRHVPSPEGDVQKTHADITKARKELGYQPQTSFEKGIEECVRWCMETCAV